MTVAPNSRLPDMSDWKNYQISAAHLFSSLGFISKIEETILGARGKHQVDVWVIGNTNGIDFKWVVECKYWRHRIPKEKVMALISIVQDIGADRGFLLSEIGFQSGAIQAAQKSNVTLTSLANLKNQVNESLIRSSAAQLQQKISSLKNKLIKSNLKNLSSIGQLAHLEIAITNALEGKFPVAYTFDANDIRLFATDWQELIARASEISANIEIIFKGTIDHGPRT